MIALLPYVVFGSVLICAQPKIENKTSEWNANDQYIFELQKDQCRKRFERSKCLARFIKKGYNDYHVSCGGGIGEN